MKACTATVTASNVAADNEQSFKVIAANNTPKLANACEGVFDCVDSMHDFTANALNVVETMPSDIVTLSPFTCEEKRTLLEVFNTYNQ